MKFSIGDVVITRPDLEKQPFGWDLDGEMWGIHLDRISLTITSIYSEALLDPQYFCSTNDRYSSDWVYKESELIPYKNMLEEAEEL